jgi:aspartyl protease family protein
MLVDTGATYSVIPRGMARALGIKHLRAVRISTADGRRLRVTAGLAVFALGGREIPSTVLVADVSEPILGAGALEALGFRVDLRQRRVRRLQPYALRL